MVEKQSNTKNPIETLTSVAAEPELPAEAPAQLAATAASISRPQRYYHGSGHLIDAGLQTEYDAEKTQGILFPEILKRQLQLTGAEIVADRAGFDYSEAEFLLKHTLMEILWETRGNDGSFGNQPLFQGKPVIEIGVYELAQRRFGSNKVSGVQLKDIHATIQQLHKRSFWIQRTYIEPSPPGKSNKNKRTKQKRFTTWSSIRLFDLHIAQESDDSSRIEPSLSTVAKGKKFVFIFDPIFVQNIAAWYVRFPIGWTENVRKAYGDHAGIKPYRMAEYLFELHAYQSKHPDRPYHEIDRDKFLYKIGMVDELKDGRRSRIDTALKKLFAVFSKEPLPLLADVQILKGAKAQEKIRFFLNSAFFEQPLPQNPKEGGGA
jgi:hypothetical protein